jgi:hypothetical protein
MIGTIERRLGPMAGVISAACLAAALPATAAATRPDDRPGLRGPDAGTIIRLRPDDRGGVRGPSAAPPVLHSVTATSGAFDWDDAATGAAVMFGAISFAGIALMASSRRRGRVAQPVVTPSERSA